LYFAHRNVDHDSAGLSGDGVGVVPHYLCAEPGWQAICEEVLRWMAISPRSVMSAYVKRFALSQ
jgi:hypothetical protein